MSLSTTPITDMLETKFSFLMVNGEVDLERYALLIIALLAAALVGQAMIALLWGATRKQIAVVLAITLCAAAFALNPLTMFMLPLGAVAAHFIAYRKPL